MVEDRDILRDDLIGKNKGVCSRRGERQPEPVEKKRGRMPYQMGGAIVATSTGAAITSRKKS